MLRARAEVIYAVNIDTDGPAGELAATIYASVLDHAPCEIEGRPVCEH
jgi:hypothetical protein